MAALRQREQEQDVSFQPWMALLQLRVKGAVLDQHCSAVLILHPTLNFAQSIKANRSDILLTTRECVS
uniref:Uncharacterized protein n=1 Tax=Romanomermis culicivorax TaxID=13658 RepID=A0A915J0G7_ROMCU